jgi:hypothetical protein
VKSCRAGEAVRQDFYLQKSFFKRDSSVNKKKRAFHQNINAKEIDLNTFVT